MVITETTQLRFSSDVYIEIKSGKKEDTRLGDITVWNRGTGYGQALMSEALTYVESIVGHTAVTEIVVSQKRVYSRGINK